MPKTKTTIAEKTEGSYQSRLKRQLERIFSDVTDEWYAFRGNRYRYAPRVDIAIGPFNTKDYLNRDERDTQKNIYRELVAKKSLQVFLERCYEYHCANFKKEQYTDVPDKSFPELVEGNPNPRCLLTIEIEDTNTKKHMMGSVVNAASLGKIGIGIGFSDDAFKAFLRIVNYLSFLKAVEKGSYDTANFMVLTPSQLEAAIRSTKKRIL